MIVEDDKGISTQLKWGLGKNYKVQIAGTRKKALEIMENTKPDLVILDLGLPPSQNDATEGLACLKNILEDFPQTKVIVVTGNEERKNALQAVGMGAYDFYQKPIDLEILKAVLHRAFNLIGLERDYHSLKKMVSISNSFEGMIGCCTKMQEAFSVIKKVSSSDATILITGNSGTGKELVARAIHNRSLRKDGHFVPINCGAIPENLIESELFGYEKGAFTDAKTQKIGMVEKASGGTLFLDEIGEFPRQLQVKLLRFIQEQKIQRVGGSEEIKVDLRIVAATNVDLEKAVKNGTFREDLFYRINVINISLPPLNERGDDLLILARSFFKKFCRKNGINLTGFSQKAINALYAYHWPGNIRELENKIQRAIFLADGPVLGPKDLALLDVSKEKHATGPQRTLKEIRTQTEIAAIKNALLHNEGNISRAAEMLDVSRPTLHDLINKYSFKTSTFKISNSQPTTKKSISR